MNLKVLFIYPIESGLKAFVEYNDEPYFITFQEEKKDVIFKLYKNDSEGELITYGVRRQQMLKAFMLFLKEKKENIKVGVYFRASKEMYNQMFKLQALKEHKNGLIDVEFTILDQEYSITGIQIIKNKSEIYINDSVASYKHLDAQCFCQNIKHLNNIYEPHQCLVLLEHQDIITNWIKTEYKRKFIPKTKAVIHNFPNT